MDYSPKETAKLLDIAPVTLRKWSNEFTASLSTSASKAITSSGGTAQRRYSDSDLIALQRAKALLAGGRTYDQVRRELSATSTTSITSITQQQPTINLELSQAAEIISTQQIAITALQDQVALLKKEIVRLETEHKSEHQGTLASIRKFFQRQKN